MKEKNIYSFYKFHKWAELSGAANFIFVRPGKFSQLTKLNLLMNTSTLPLYANINYLVLIVLPSIVKLIQEDITSFEDTATRQGLTMTQQDLDI